MPAQPRIDCWLHNEGTNIIGEKAVKGAKTQLIDALIAYYAGLNSRANELRLVPIRLLEGC